MATCVLTSEKELLEAQKMVIAIKRISLRVSKYKASHSSPFREVVKENIAMFMNIVAFEHIRRAGVAKPRFYFSPELKNFPERI